MCAMADQAAGQKLALAVIRKQKQMKVELSDYAYVVSEHLETTEFKMIPVAAVPAVVPVKVSFGGADLNKDAVALLLDGKVALNRGPTFANGVDTGKYRLDLAEARNVSQVNTYASGRTRARQSFVLYGSSAASDPGWNVADTTVFTRVVTVDSRPGHMTEYEATSIRRSAGKPLGSFRWLVWAASPTNGEIGGQNTTFEEMQVIPAPGESQ
jgi:hypothetical protein